MAESKMQGGILGVDAQIDVLRIFFVCSNFPWL